MIIKNSGLCPCPESTALIASPRSSPHGSLPSVSVVKLTAQGIPAFWAALAMPEASSG